MMMESRRNVEVPSPPSYDSQSSGRVPHSERRGRIECSFLIKIGGCLPDVSYQHRTFPFTDKRQATVGRYYEESPDSKSAFLGFYQETREKLPLGTPPVITTLWT